MKNIFCVVLFFVFSNAVAFELKTLEVTGTGCEKKTLTDIRPVQSSQYKFPVTLNVIKHESSQLERKTCVLALPVKLSKKEKLQVSNVSQNVTVKAFGGAQLKVSLDVSSPNSLGPKKPLEIEVKNPTALEQELKFEGVVFESKCGQDAIIRANVNTFIQGPGTASVTVEELSMNVKAVPCTK